MRKLGGSFTTVPAARPFFHGDNCVRRRSENRGLPLSLKREDEMQTSKAFWSVLWDVLSRANGNEEALKGILQSLPRQIIIDFSNEFRRAMTNLYEIEYEASEDYQKDISALIVSKGKEYYDEIVNHPERVPHEIDPNGPYFLHVPAEVFRDRFGEELMDQS